MHVQKEKIIIKRKLFAKKNVEKKLWMMMIKWCKHKTSSKKYFVIFWQKKFKYYQHKTYT